MGIITPPRAKVGNKKGLARFFSRKSNKSETEKELSPPTTPGLDSSMESNDNLDPPGIDRTSGTPRIRSVATPPRVVYSHGIHQFQTSRTEPSSLSKLPLSDDPDECEILQLEHTNAHKEQIKEEARKALARIEMASRRARQNHTSTIRSGENYAVAENTHMRQSSPHTPEWSESKLGASTKNGILPSPPRKPSVSSTRRLVLEVEDLHKMDCAAEVYDMMRETTGVSKSSNPSMDTDEFSIGSEVQELVKDTTYFCRFFGETMTDTCARYQEGKQWK